jgi:tetratricopeptide (TPR) repeat protein
MYRISFNVRPAIIKALLAVPLALLLVGTSAAQDAAGAAQQEINLGDEQQRAEQAIAEGRFGEAIQIYTRIGQAVEQQFREGTIRPELVFYARAAVYTGRGRALAGMQEYAAADEEFRQALEIVPEFPDTLLARGEMLLDLGAASMALPDFQGALKTDRANLRGLFGLGKSQVMLRQYQEAIKPLSRVIEAEEFPKKAEAYRLRGIANGGIFKMPLAIADLNESIRLDAEAYESYFELGVIYLRQENYQAALEEVDRSISRYKPPAGREEEPYLQGYLFKAAIQIEIGKAAKDDEARQAAYRGAVETSQQILDQLDPENPLFGGARATILVSRGIAERMLKQYGAAIQTFSQSLELNPALGEAYFRRGICFHLINEDKLAVSDFRQAAVINFEDPRGNLWEGFVFAKLGNYHEAIRAYGDAIAASDRYTPAYVNRGLAYMMLGEYEKAVADFNDAIRIEPTNADYYFKRGVAYQQLADLERARDSYGSAIRFEPTMGLAYRNLADVVQALGHPDLASEYREKADQLERQPAAG